MQYILIKLADYIKHYGMESTSEAKIKFKIKLTRCKEDLLRRSRKTGMETTTPINTSWGKTS